MRPGGNRIWYTDNKGLMCIGPAKQRCAHWKALGTSRSVNMFKIARNLVKSVGHAARDLASYWPWCFP